MHILYVDTDEALAHAVEEFLSDCGFRVDVSLFPEDALFRFELSDYDMVIAEYALPGMTGIDLLHHVRAINNAMPFVLFTSGGGADEADVAIASLNAGVDFYLRKGSDPEARFNDLVGAIIRVVGEKRALRAFCPPEPFENVMQMILESSDEPTFFIDLNRVILWANKSFYTFLNSNAVNAVGKHCYEVVWGRSAPCKTCRIPKVVASGRGVSAEVLHPGGWYSWITTYPVTDSAGRKIGYVGKITDITVVKQSQEAVRQEREKYNLLFQSANDMIYLHDPLTGGVPGKILEVNNAACRRMGYSREELLRMTISDIDDPLLDVNLGSLISEIGERGHFIFEWRHVTKGGNSVPVEVSVNVFQMGGRPVALSIVRDITERKESEQALVHREQEYRDLVENINEVIFLIDFDGTILYISPAVEQLGGGSGYLPGALIGKNFIDFIHPEDREVLRGHLRERLSGITRRSTFRLLTKSGAVRWVLESSRPIWEDGVAVGIQGVFLDITDLRMMDAALKKANKKLNILSSITRHDILNQITSMNLSLDLIEDDSGDPQKREEFFEAAESIMGNLERIITFTRDYEDLGVKEPEWQDVGAIIDQETGSFDGNIIVSNEVHGLEIYADSMLGKVFSNLVGNSVMHGVKAESVTFSFEEREGCVCIVITDDGVGISCEMKERIFSKGVGKNTGFGLFLSREILDLTGFSICESGVPGTGARFEILVPEGKFRYISGV